MNIQNKDTIFKDVLWHIKRVLADDMPLDNLANFLMKNTPEYFYFIKDVAFFKKNDYIWTSKCKNLFCYMNNGIILNDNQRDDFLDWCLEYYEEDGLTSELYIAFNKATEEYMKRGKEWFTICSTVMKYTILHYQSFLRSAYSTYIKERMSISYEETMNPSYIGESYIISYTDFDILDEKNKRFKIFYQFLNKTYGTTYEEFCKILNINSPRTLRNWIDISFKQKDLYHKYAGEYY